MVPEYPAPRPRTAMREGWFGEPEPADGSAWHGTGMPRSAAPGRRHPRVRLASKNLPEGLTDQRAVGEVTPAHALMDIREQHAPLFPCDAFQEGPIRASAV